MAEISRRLMLAFKDINDLIATFESARIPTLIHRQF
jgi:hypothetical protein